MTVLQDLDEAFDVLPGGVAITLPDNDVILQATKRASTIFRCDDPTELIGRSWTELVFEPFGFSRAVACNGDDLILWVDTDPFTIDDGDYVLKYFREIVRFPVLDALIEAVTDNQTVIQDLQAELHETRNQLYLIRQVLVGVSAALSVIGDSPLTA